MKYIMRVSDRTLTSSLHEDDCAVVTRRQPHGYHVHKVEGANAQDAVATWDSDNDNVARGLPATKICDCIRE